jgi:transcriptional regulator with PAS, ATPase and Fis domain
MSTVMQPQAPAGAEGFYGLVGRHPLMLALFERIGRAARHQLPVLIVGETGTGKELVANALHLLSGAKGAMIALNVALLSEQLADAELFGTVRGAYTGAVDRPGLIEAASAGTLFLDEAAELSCGTQARLLRALESFTVRRLGGRHEHPVRFRLLLSLQQAASTLVARRVWRDDFCHRVNGITLSLPPVRERPEDIPLLINHTLGQLGRPPIPEVELRTVGRYAWPGNVRELLRVVERAVFAAEAGPVSASVLEHEIGLTGGADGLERHALKDSIRALARMSIQRALSEAHNDKMAAAAALGLSVHQLYRRIKTLGITAPRSR